MYSGIVSSFPTLWAPTYNAGANSLTWSSLSMTGNATWSIVVEAVVSTLLGTGDIITNQWDIFLNPSDTSQCIGCHPTYTLEWNWETFWYILPEIPEPYDLIIWKETTETTGVVGQIIDFTITVTNSGYDGTDIRIVDMFEDDFAIVSILVTDMPTVDCSYPILACTPTNTAIELCVDFCELGYSIDMLSSADEADLTILSDNCFRYLPSFGYTGTSEVVISACDPSGESCELKSVSITVSDDCVNEGAALLLEADCEIIIPNVLTPNNDGINDNLIVSAIRDCYSDWDMKFILFDRWGRVMAEQDNPNANLINDINLSLLKQETYFYTLELYKADTKNVFSGFIEVRK